MNIHRGTAKRRLGVKTMLLAALAGGMIAATAFSPAFATPTPGVASGATTLTLGGKAYNILQSGPCGTLVATGVNGVTVTPVTKGIKLIFPISGMVTQPDNTDALRIDHSGSVTLENDCYSITLSTLRITNFGLPDQGSSFDVSAVTKSADDFGRQVVFTLDLSGAQIVFSGNKVRTAQMNLITAAEGAQELNELAVNAETGPFVAGQKIGSAKTRLVLP